MNEKTVVVTGASKGIGAQTAKVFANSGANVVLLARDRQALEKLSAELPTPSLAVGCDVSDYTQVQSAITAAVDRFGEVDVLVNNAGVIEPISRIANSDPAGWARAIDVNLTGVYNGVRAVLPHMLKAGGGTILTVSSGAAHNALEAWSHYCASKAGAAMLTQCIDKEERDQGIRAMGLSPGSVATQMQRDIKQSGINPVSELDWSDHISPDWPARALLWMCSQDADEYLGSEISLRDQIIRNKIGLTE